MAESTLPAVNNMTKDDHKRPRDCEQKQKHLRQTVIWWGTKSQWGGGKRVGKFIEDTNNKLD